MTQRDIQQRFIFEHAPVRGEIVHLQDAYQKIIGQQEYPPMVKHLLGEALVSCLLMASSIKFEGMLALQFQGDASLPLLIVQADHHLNIRACATFQEGLGDDVYSQSFLHGNMTVNINQNNQTNPYQSVIPIQSTSMAENLMQYFAQSEQLSTQIWLAVNDTQASGMMLQLMPTDSDADREEFWQYAVQIGGTITPHELWTLDNTELLHRLYHETELRLFEPRPTQFKCRCSQEKMRQVLMTLGKEDAEALIAERGSIEVVCDFCHQEYQLDVIDVAMIFS